MIGARFMRKQAVQAREVTTANQSVEHNGPHQRRVAHLHLVTRSLPAPLHTATVGSQPGSTFPRRAGRVPRVRRIHSVDHQNDRQQPPRPIMPGVAPHPRTHRIITGSLRADEDLEVAHERGNGG
jgi:hypothetical protein